MENDGLLLEIGIADNPTTMELSLDVMMTTGGVNSSGNTTGTMVETVAYEPSQHRFLTMTPTNNNGFINFDVQKLGGYDFEDKLMPYDAIVLEEDADKYSEDRIDCAPSSDPVGTKMYTFYC